MMEESRWRKREQQLLAENNRLLNLCREKDQRIAEVEQYVVCELCSTEEAPSAKQEVCEWIPIDEHATSYAPACGFGHVWLDLEQVECHRCGRPISIVALGGAH